MTPFDRAPDLRPSTRRAYATSWHQFEAWCAHRGSTPMPARPRLVIAYLRYLVNDQLSAESLKQACKAIGKAHELGGLPSPMAHPLVLAWRRRLLSTRDPRRAVATFQPEQFRAIVTAICAQRLRDLRDRALLLLGYAAQLRPSELTAVNVEHVAFVSGGLELWVGDDVRFVRRRGRAQKTCPVWAVEQWLAASRARTGPLFVSITRFDAPRERLSDRGVNMIVQRRAHAAGVWDRGISADSLHLGRRADRRIL